jgi:hypothetical protein
MAVLATVAALAAAPVLHPAKDYDTFHVKGIKHGFNLTLITSATNPKRLIAGPVTPPLASQFPLSTGSIPCPKAKRNPGLPKADKQFAAFSFPGATLKIKHHRYSFEIKKVVQKEFVFGSPVKPFKLTVTLTGTVTSPTTIAGKVTFKGGPCTVKGAIAYTVKQNNGVTVAPGT